MSHTPAPASPEAGHGPARITSEGHLTVGDVVALVEAAAPPGLAASWDSNGLICGDPAESVRSILLAVDPVSAVVDEAIDAGVDHAVDAALKGGNVELVVFGIGNNDGRDNAGEFLSCHKNLLSCLAGGPMPPTLVGSVQAV